MPTIAPKHRPPHHPREPVVDFHLHLNSEMAKRAHPAVPLCVESHTTVRAALVLMKEKNRGTVLVCFQGRLAGIFTERDALRCMAQSSDLDVPIQQVMSEAPTALAGSDTVGIAIAKMAEGGYRRLPIVDGAGRPTGILKVSGILHYLVEHFPKVIYNLPPTPDQTTQHREGA
jgi:CBS domain-containing protein